MRNITPSLNSQKTPHSSPSRTSYVVSIVMILETIDPWTQGHICYTMVHRRIFGVHRCICEMDPLIRTSPSTDDGGGSLSSVRIRNADGTHVVSHLQRVHFQQSDVVLVRLVIVLIMEDELSDIPQLVFRCVILRSKVDSTHQDNIVIFGKSFFAVNEIMEL